MHKDLNELIDKLDSTDSKSMKVSVEKGAAAPGGQVLAQPNTKEILDELARLHRTIRFLFSAFAKYFFSHRAYEEFLKSLQEVESEHSHLECNDNEGERQHDSQT